MNKNIVIVMVGAVLVAALVALLVKVSLGDKAPVQVAEAPKVEVLVAAKDLSLGHTLVADDLRWQNWPANSTFTGMVKRKDNMAPGMALKGRLARPVAAGEPMMISALLANQKGNIVAASLEPGQRAVSIGVSATSMVSGFATPGDHVDIVLTYKEDVDAKDDDPNAQSLIDMNLDKLAVETILQNIKILAVDQMAQSPKDDKIRVGRTVTVAVGLEQAEMLALAAEIGSLSLVLRGKGDDQIVERAWPIISDARMTKMDDDILMQYHKYKKDAGINRNIVRIYSGEQVQDVMAH